MIEGLSTNNQWVHMYLFADKFDVPGLRKDVINHYFEKCWGWTNSTQSCHLSYQEIILAFRHLPTSSPLCRLMIGTYAVTWASDGDASCLIEANMRSKLPLAFTYPAMKRIRQRTDDDSYRNVDDLCTFHEHGEDVQEIEACEKRSIKMEGRGGGLSCSCMDAE
jgi:hypothetical protein